MTRTESLQTKPLSNDTQTKSPVPKPFSATNPPMEGKNWDSIRKEEEEVAKKLAAAIKQFT